MHCSKTLEEFTKSIFIFTINLANEPKSDNLLKYFGTGI